MSFCKLISTVIGMCCGQVCRACTCGELIISPGRVAGQWSEVGRAILAAVHRSEHVLGSHHRRARVGLVGLPSSPTGTRRRFHYHHLTKLIKTRRSGLMPSREAKEVKAAHFGELKYADQNQSGRARAAGKTTH